MVKVKPTEKYNKITVKANNETNVFSVKDNMSEYYAKLSERWASADGMVDGIDYSSKYYSNVSKECMEIAQSYRDEIINTASGFQDIVDNSKEEIEVIAQNNISNLRASAETTMSEIQETIDSSLETINTAVSENISTIESKANEEIENLNKEIEQGKDEIKDTIDGIKVLTTLKIGQIGIAPLGIDETLNMERYLNGQIIIQDQFKGFTKFLKKRIELYPSLACTEDEWQTTVTMSAFSQCGKFVIDDNAGTIRLPKVVNIQGLTDLSKLGEIVEAGLPTHTHTRGTMNITGQTDGGFSKWNASGAFYNTGKTHDSFGSGASGFNIQNFDASRSWTGSTSTGNYSKALATTNTVQQEQIQYPYFIQVATGAETEDNIVNEIELNNPYSFGDSKYSPKPLNNLSWLKSEGQWNSKAVYPSCYDWALTNANNGVEGFVTTNMYYFKCTTEDLVYCLTTATAKIGQAIYGLNTGFKGCVEEVTSNGFKFTDKEKGFIEFITDTNSYTHNPTGYEFVINTADETFKLPLLDGSEVLPSDRQEVISFNTDATYYVSKPVNGFYTLICRIANQGTGVAITNKATQQSARSNASFGNTMCAVTLFVPANNQVVLWKSALATTNPVNECYFIPAQGNGSLYYYVGETVQNANLINAGRIEEVVSQIKADKLDKSAVKAYIVESYVNGTSWYNRYSNGWIEQGGRIVINSATVGGGTYNNTTLTFIKPFSKLMSWHCQAQHDRFNAGFHADVGGAVSSVNVYQVNDSTGSFWNAFVLWEAKGYIA